MDNPNLRQAQFRFYEELNDFLLTNEHKRPLNYTFKGNPAIKDAIEAIGVPHTEVDLILVNGASVNFQYQLQDGDRVAVYPMFEALDISSISKVRTIPLRQPKFILDVHLGKLNRLLRMLGFDCEYHNTAADAEIIKQALTEHRIILTRDKMLLKNKTVSHGYWLRATDPWQQLTEVLNRFDLVNKIKPFSRCISCNGDIQKVNKQAVIHHLPPKTKQYYNDFYQCQACHKIYWQGSHYDKMLRLIKELQKAGHASKD